MPSHSARVVIEARGHAYVQMKSQSKRRNISSQWLSGEKNSVAHVKHTAKRTHVGVRGVSITTTHRGPHVRLIELLSPGDPRALARPRPQRTATRALLRDHPLRLITQSLLYQRHPSGASTCDPDPCPDCGGGSLLDHTWAGFLTFLGSVDLDYEHLG